MRLSQLSLIKYGKFSDEVLAFPAAAHDFHVIVGPNEAGKSTVRTAVSELLFGMKLQTPLDFLHNTPELRLGGVIEGRLGRTEFHRARGRSSLRSPADDKLPEDHLAAWLDGATREFFEQMFGLDHDRLLEGGKSLLNASDKLGQVLFESAAGVGSLGPVREALEGRATELWAPRRANCEQAVAEAALTQASTDLKTVQVRTRDWAEQKEALAAITTQIDEARAAQSRLETDRARLERIRRLAPYMQELAAKEEALAAMVLAGPVIELPDTATDELLSARSQIAVAQSLLAERRADWQARQQARAALQANDAVLALASDIEALDRLRGACINHPRDLPLRQAEADRHLAAALDAASQLAWPTEEATLRNTLPKALALKTVTQLLREHGALQQAALSTAEALAEKTRELSELSAERQH
ncbi:AAA family ATPase, partial [Ideonella sp.]|uniref:YhaN family protein n=1 Tax=Ideonella sp. TaxID=1929293 RepID=UPI003BB69B4D